jgi:polar amino acid transport system ATP-binding protein
MIKCRNVSKKYDSLEVLKAINLDIKKGEIVSIIGPSGSGKSTLLKVIASLESIDSGIIETNGSLGMVFQNYNLFKNMNAIENITIGLKDVKKNTSEEALLIARDSLKKVGLADRENHYPNQLSGGQKQRLSIARSLAMSSDIILFDEPTAALDPELTQEVLQTIKSLADEGLSLVIVTHEVEFAKAISDRIIFMEDGEIIMDAHIDEISYNSSDRIREYLKI